MAASKGITCEAKGVDALISQLDRVPQELIKGFIEIGELAVNKAREKAKARDWTDQTGNLRSSIGYVVVDHGEIIAGGQCQQYKGGSEGVQEGNDLLERLAREFRHKLAVIVCAGMHYASYVQSRGYDVDMSAEQLAERLANELMEDIDGSFK